MAALRDQASVLRDKACEGMFQGNSGPQLYIRVGGSWLACRKAEMAVLLGKGFGEIDSPSTILSYPMSERLCYLNH